MNNLSWKSTLTIAALAVLMLSSCAPRVPFTQANREEYKLTAEEMQGIQFYVSNDIILVRGQKDDDQRQTTDGTLTVKSGSSVEEIVIKAGTPGVVTKVIDNNTIAVSFDAADNEGLIFSDAENKKGPYYFQTLPWKGNKRQVKYQGEMYATSAGSKQVYLVFKMKQIRSFKKEQTVVKGRKL